MLADSTIANALASGSSDIGEGLRHWRDDPHSRKGAAAERSLVRYLSRMAGRPTPFGSLASYALVTFDGPTELMLGDRRDLRSVRRLDPGHTQRVVAQTASDRAPAEALRIRPNPLAYRIGNRYRVPAHVGSSNGRTLLAVLGTPSVDAAVAAAAEWPTVERAMEMLAGQGFPDPATIVQRALSRELVIPAPAVGVIGTEPTQQASQLLEELGAYDVRAALDAVVNVIESADDLAAAATEVRHLLRRVGLEPPPRRTIQVDTVRPGSIRLASATTDQLRRAAELVTTVAGRAPHPLASFVDAFSRRFGTRAVPLLEALDPDHGLRLEDEQGAATEEDVVARRRRRALQSLLVRGARSPDGEVELTADDVAALTDPSAPRLDGAFSVVASIAAENGDAIERGDYQIWTPSISAPGGGRLVGRFCHGDDELSHAVRRHFAREAQVWPNDLLAEIAVCPDVDWGLNVTHRPALRDLQIDMGGASNPRDPGVLSPADLLVTVADGEVVLWSRRHNRRVRPRMASAMNLQWLTVPAARFLALLAEGESHSRGWSWGDLVDAPFLPRLRRGRVVLVGRRWMVPTRDLVALEKSADLLNAVRCWREGLGLPRWVQLELSKGPMLVDLENILMVGAVLTECRRAEAAAPTTATGTAIVRLAETVAPGASAVCGPDGRYAHELVVAFSSTNLPGPALVASGPPDVRAAEDVDRTFLPGSSWLFGKLYGPASAADRVLTERLAPLIASLRDENVVQQWFFIRYADPDRHVRLRLNGDPDALTRVAMPRLHDAVTQAVAAGDLHTMSFDTYEREVERYGGAAGVSAMERIAEADSDAFLALLQVGAVRSQTRLDLAVASVMALYSDAGLNPDQLDECARQLRDAFVRRLTPAGTRRLGTEFRSVRDRITDIASGDGQLIHPGVQVILADRSAVQAPVLADLRGEDARGRLSQPYLAIVQSLAHMALNRLLRDGGGADEARVHDIVARISRERLARGGSKILGIS
nr:lantibiotic dehydratase [Allobranchiibius huperziae]